MGGFWERVFFFFGEGEGGCVFSGKSFFFVLFVLRGCLFVLFWWEGVCLLLGEERVCFFVGGVWSWSGRGRCFEGGFLGEEEEVFF